MCYNIASSLQSQLKRAIHNNNQAQIADILKKIEQYNVTSHFQLSGFSHNEILIYTSQSPNTPTPSVWGLIPHWVKNENQKVKLWNSTLNARGETIFDKPSFKKSAREMRCVIHLDGYFEHHHFNNKKYPFFITQVDNAPISIGGLYSEWVDTKSGEIINSFSIVTTEGNEFLSKIHNNPKLEQPRMPLVLNEQEEELWLQNESSDLFIEEIKSIIKPNLNIKFKAHTVKKLSGHGSIGNNQEAHEEFKYEELPKIV